MSISPNGAFSATCAATPPGPTFKSIPPVSIMSTVSRTIFPKNALIIFAFTFPRITSIFVIDSSELPVTVCVIGPNDVIFVAPNEPIVNLPALIPYSPCTPNL